MNHSQIIGHSTQLEQLTQDISSENISHAYLFNGPDSIGKFTIARLFAQTLQCQTPSCPTSQSSSDKTETASLCPTCLQIQKGQHFDTIELLNDGHVIKIATIRETVERIHTSRQGAYMCILIEDADRFTAAAANCLLKTLEEPPKNTVFILTATNASSILDTIISRTRTINFHQVPTTTLQEKLVTLFPESSSPNIESAIEYSMKKPGIAISLLSDPESFEATKSLHSKINNLLTKPTSINDKLQLIESETADRQKAIEFNNALIYQLYKHSSSNPKYLNVLPSTYKIPSLLNRNVNTRLLFENLLLAI